jgi:hypothetical protein
VLLMYERAYDFGVKDGKGYDAAAEAMRKLAEAAPDRADEARQKLLTVYQLRYRKAKGAARQSAAADLVGEMLAVADARSKAGDDAEAMRLYRQALTAAGAAPAGVKEQVQAKVKLAEGRRQAQVKVDKLLQKIKANPDDSVAAGELARLYLLELDDPAKAGEYAQAAGDDDMARWAPAAARDLEELDEEQLIGLAGWYAGLAAKPAVAVSARAVALGRARTYGQAFLDAHPEKDAERFRAEQVVTKAVADLEKIRPGSGAGSGGGPRVDLLALVDPRRDAVLGTWTKDDDGLVTDNRGYSRVELRYTPPPEYDFEVSFTRKDGEGGVCLILHANGRSALWVIGVYKNTTAGFDGAGGEPLKSPKNPTLAKVPNIITNGKRHTAVLRVRRGGVAAVLDGKPLSAWKTDFSDATLDGKYALRRDDVLGLVAQGSPVTFHSAAVTEVSGKGKLHAPGTPKGKP